MKRQVVIHPILFALFPVFLIYAPNQVFFGLEIILRPALICILGIALVWSVLWTAMGPMKRAAQAVSVFWLLLFSFESFRHSFTQLSSEAGFSGIGMAHQIILGSVAITIALFVASLGKSKDLERATYLFNVIGTILVCMSFTDIVVSRLSVPNTSPLPSGYATLDEGIDQPLDVMERPDIYYIVLDAYGRADQLQRLYGFDNGAFLAFLDEQGFYVAPHAAANYPQTLLSIASSLNFEYLHTLLGTGLREVQDRRFARHLLRNSRTIRLLRDIGYQITTIPSPYYDADIVGADTVVADWHYPTLFETMLLDVTPLPWTLSKLGVNFPYNLHRSRILFSLDELSKMPRQPGPKFVYSHILYAHPPFVFDEHGMPATPNRPYRWHDGEAYFEQTNATRDEYVDGYRRQVRFLNRRLQDTLTAIFANSQTPPIIIVQGDHGSGLGLSQQTLERTDVEERYGILSAYYLPGSGDNLLYESVSPVNSFRIIFNHYFGTSFPVLKDKRYYTPFERPYDFTLVDSEAVAKNASQTDGHGTAP